MSMGGWSDRRRSLALDQAGREDVVEHQHLALRRRLVLGQLLQEHPRRPDRGDLRG